MEGPPYFCQRAAIIVLTQQHGHVFIDGFENFAGFFHEDLDDFIVDQVVVVENGWRRCRFFLYGGRRRGFGRHRLVVMAGFAGVGHGLGTLDQRIDIAGGIAVTELLDQGGYPLVGIGNQTEQIFSGFQALIQHPVEQVFNRPGQLANTGGSHQSSTALEGVVGAAHFGQGFAIVVILAQARIPGVDGTHDFTGFFHEDFQNLVVHQLHIRALG